MNILIASDSFKGTLSSTEIMNKLEIAAKRHLSCEVYKIPMSDGGEGTVEALVSALDGSLARTNVTGPVFQKIEAEYGIVNNDTAIIEMAQASGLHLAGELKNPIFTTSFGTGELIKEAAERGYKKIILGIGGSATNDGGIGAMMALGVKFFDCNNELITEGTGIRLQDIRSINTEGIIPEIRNCQIEVICDVTNPLVGANGATAVFGPQKGADPEKIKILERGMENYARVVAKDIGRNYESLPGAGAAGGLGYALKVFLDAKLKKGIDAVLDLVGFDELIKNIDLVITGEGNMDSQSAYGKVPVGIAERCKQHGVPVIVIVGGLGEGTDYIYEKGISAVFPVIPRAMALDEAIKNANDIFDAAADRMFRFIKTARELK